MHLAGTDRISGAFSPVDPHSLLGTLPPFLFPTVGFGIDSGISYSETVWNSYVGTCVTTPSGVSIGAGSD